MCGRYNDHLPKMHGWNEALKEWPEHARSYNRTPTTNVAAFRGDSGELMRWGMIAPWSKSFESSYATFNARAESVAEKATFRNAWKNKQHCLVPMAGYYEWIGPKGNKQPFYITDRNAGAIVTAGLFDEWGEDGNLSCTIITREADEEMSNIHPRIPVMLTPENYQSWLGGEQDLDKFKRPDLLYYPVSTAVGNVRNNGPELICINLDSI